MTDHETHTPPPIQYGGAFTREEPQMAAQPGAPQPQAPAPTPEPQALREMAAHLAQEKQGYGHTAPAESVEDVLRAFQVDAQSQGPEQPFTMPQDEPEPGTGPEPEPQPANPRIDPLQIKLRNINGTVAMGLMFANGTKEHEPYKATDEEMQELGEALQAWKPDFALKLSPFVDVLWTAARIWGYHVYTALKFRFEQLAYWWRKRQAAQQQHRAAWQTTVSRTETAAPAGQPATDIPEAVVISETATAAPKPTEPPKKEQGPAPRLCNMPGCTTELKPGQAYFCNVSHSNKYKAGVQQGKYPKLA